MENESKQALDMRPTRVIPRFAFSEKWNAEVLMLKVKKPGEPWVDYELSITRDYVTDWTPSHALRELIANSLDAVGGDSGKIGLTFSKPNQNKSKTVIRNAGASLRLEHFLLGGGESGDDTIGQFREGLKLALLVLTRAGYAVNLTFSPTKTEIMILGLETETVKNAKALFRAFQNHKVLWHNESGEAILSGARQGGKMENAVYVQGLKQDLGERKLYFSFAFNKETVPIGRDRHIASTYALRDSCAEVIWKVTEPRLMAEITDVLLKTQGALYFDLTAERLRWQAEYGELGAWEEYFKTRFSEYVICDSDREKYHIESLGKKALILVDSNLAEIFEALGVETFENLTEEDWDIRSWDFAGEDRALLDRYLDTIDTVFPELNSREYEYSLFDENVATRRRRAFIKGQAIYIRLNHWERGNRLTIFGTLLHELAHQGGDDLSSGFEGELTLLLGKAVNFISEDRRTIEERSNRQGAPHPVCQCSECKE